MPEIRKVFSAAYDRIIQAHNFFEQRGIGGVTSTSRGAESYRKDLFPDFKTVKNLLDFLQEKVVIDVGSGLTHKNPYSLINLVSENSENKTTFIGIEPRAGIKDGFGKFDNSLLAVSNLVRLFRHLFKGESWSKKTIQNAKPKVVAAKAEALSLSGKKVDIILCNYLLGWWIKEPEKLLEIFTEFDRVLKPGGEIRIHPATLEFQQFLTNVSTSLGDFLTNNFIIQNQEAEGKVMCLVFRKKQDNKKT